MSQEKRKRLAEYKDTRQSFSAYIGEFCKREGRICLTFVKDIGGSLVADHLWVFWEQPLRKAYYKAQGKFVRITFTAEVYEYVQEDTTKYSIKNLEDIRFARRSRRY